MRKNEKNGGLPPPFSPYTAGGDVSQLRNGDAGVCDKNGGEKHEFGPFPTLPAALGA